MTNKINLNEGYAKLIKKTYLNINDHVHDNVHLQLVFKSNSLTI